MPSLKYWDGAAWRTLIGGMASGVPAGGAIGQVLSKKTASDYDTQWVSSELDYKQITADVSVAATTEAAATTVITGNSVTFDGSRVKIEFFSPSIVIGGGITYLTVVLLRDAVVIGQARSGFAGGTGPIEEMALKAEVFDTPTAGAHAYSIKAFVSGSSGVVRAGLGVSGALLPAFLRVTRA